MNYVKSFAPERCCAYARDTPYFHRGTRVVAFTAKLTTVFETLVGDQFGQAGRTTGYRLDTAKLTAADKWHEQTFVLSAGLSAQPITIAPLGVSAPGILVYLCCDYPVDIRTNSPSDAVFLSGVQLFQMAGSISNVYLSTGATATTVLLKVAGGSSAQLYTTFPLP
jgi:hypothetical protein